MCFLLAAAVLLLAEEGEGCLAGFSYVPPYNPTTSTSCGPCPRKRGFSMEEDGQNSGRNFWISFTTAAPCCTATTTSTTTTSPVVSNRCCGIKKASTKIVGGVATTVNEYPWMTGLKYSGSSGYICGGALIASQWILSAAHCVVFRNIQQSPILYTAVLGDYSLSNATASPLRKSFAVSQIFVHPQYNRTIFDYDISLLKLATPVDLSVYNPVCLPAAGADYTGKTGFIYGWGDTSSGGTTADILQETSIPIVDLTTCQNTMSAFTTDPITPRMICAGANGKDTCQGDSGGPLTVPGADTRHELAGATSWGVGCAIPGTYGVYAATSQLRSFIDTTLASNGGATFCP